MKDPVDVEESKITQDQTSFLGGNINELMNKVLDITQGSCLHYALNILTIV